MNENNNRKYDLEERLIDFAVSIITLSETLNPSLTSAILSKQVIRSASSSALNYGEVLASESDKDFVHKMKICLKELRETLICLKIIHQKPLLKGDLIDITLDESSQLVAIFVTSIQTKKKNMSLKNR